MERELKIISYLLARVVAAQTGTSAEEVLTEAEAMIPKGAAEKRARFTPPTVEEVAAFCKERNNGIDPVKFVSHYASKGWKVGSQKMADWHQAIITWEKRNEKPGTDIRQIGKGCYYGEATL